MKVTFSLSFYHIPKFLKNDLIKRLEISIHHLSDGMLISKLSNFRSSGGGAKRDRTADLLRARQALSQLSYSPISEKHFYTLPTTFANSLLVKAKSYNVY